MFMVGSINIQFIYIFRARACFAINKLFFFLFALPDFVIHAQKNINLINALRNKLRKLSL